MPKSRQQKEAQVKLLSDKLTKSKSVVISTFTSLPVKEDQSLRGELRQGQVNYQVVKKTLIKRALDDAKLEAVDLEPVIGNITLALADDEVSAAKLVHRFAKNRDNMTILAGYLEGELIDGDKIASLASLPSKEELLAKTLATLNAPIQNFVGVLSGVTRSLVYVLNSIKEQKA